MVPHDAMGRGEPVRNVGGQRGIVGKNKLTEAPEMKGQKESEGIHNKKPKSEVTEESPRNEQEEGGG